MTVEEITKLAMQELQVLAEGEEPSQNELDLGLLRLNSLIFSLQNDDISLRAFKDAELITVSGTSVYPSEINTLRIMYFNDPRINVVDNETFDQLAFEIAGRSTVTVDYSAIPPSIKFYTPHDADGISIKYKREITFSELLPGDSLRYLQTANEMLILGLAYKLKNIYNAPPDLVLNIKRDYQEEMVKYRATQTQRSGKEIVAPSFVV